MLDSIAIHHTEGGNGHMKERIYMYTPDNVKTYSNESSRGSIRTQQLDL